MNSPTITTTANFFNNRSTKKALTQNYLKSSNFTEIDTPVPHLLSQLEQLQSNNVKNLKKTFLTSSSQQINLNTPDSYDKKNELLIARGKRTADDIVGVSEKYFSQNDVEDLLLPANKKKRFSPNLITTSQTSDNVSPGFKPFKMLRNILLKPLSLTLTPNDTSNTRNPFIGTNEFFSSKKFNNLIEKRKKLSRPNSLNSSPSHLLSEFSNFLAPQPEPLVETPKVPFFAFLPELSSEKLGGKIIFSTDDFYGTASSILKADEPCCKKNECTEVGRWIDGWETQRRRQPVHDWCIIELSFPGEIYGCEIDTTYFEGNQAPFISVEAAYAPDLSNKILEYYEKAGLPPYKAGEIGSTQSPTIIEQINSLLQEQSLQQSNQWRDIVSMSPLLPGKRNVHIPIQHYFPAIESPLRAITHLRLNLFPDGGIARFRSFGVGVPKKISESPYLVSDLSCGGVVICCSNKETCSNPQVLLQNDTASSVSDCWETVRQKDRAPCIEKKVLSADNNKSPIFIGEEWVIFRLSARCVISKIEIDTNFCYGNCPEYLSIRGVDVTQGCLSCFEDIVAQHELFSNTELDLTPVNSSSLSQKKKLKLLWKPIVLNSPIKPGTNHVFQPTARSPTETTPLTRKRRGTLRRKGATPTRRAKEVITPTAQYDCSDEFLPEIEQQHNNEHQNNEQQYKSLENILFTTTHLCVTLIPDGALSRIRVWGKTIVSENNTPPHGTDVHKKSSFKNSSHLMSFHIEGNKAHNYHKLTTPPN